MVYTARSMACESCLPGGHHGNGSGAAVRRHGGVGGGEYAVRQARYVTLRDRVHFYHADDVLVLRVLLRETAP